MSSEIYPKLLFRTCSDQSAGRLRCGRLTLGLADENDTQLDVPSEFLRHSDRDSEGATWFVSTTANFMRAIHIAFQKHEAGEDNIELIFIEPNDGTRNLPRKAERLARDCGFSTEYQKLFKHEYLFTRQIPEQCVLHRIDLHTLSERGFTVERLIGHVLEERTCLTGFCTEFRNHWSSYTVGDRSCLLATVACRFGLYSPVDDIFWALFGASIAKGSKWGDFSTLIKKNLAWAKEDYASDVGLNYLRFDTDLEDLREAWWMIKVEHEDRLDELMYSLLDDEPALDYQL